MDPEKYDAHREGKLDLVLKGRSSQPILHTLARASSRGPQPALSGRPCSAVAPRPQILQPRQPEGPALGAQRGCAAVSPPAPALTIRAALPRAARLGATSQLSHSCCVTAQLQHDGHRRLPLRSRVITCVLWALSAVAFLAARGFLRALHW